MANKTLRIVPDRHICTTGYTQGRPVSDIPAPVAMSKTFYTCRSDEAFIEREETLRSQRSRQVWCLPCSTRTPTWRESPLLLVAAQPRVLPRIGAATVSCVGHVERSRPRDERLADPGSKGSTARWGVRLPGQ